MKSSVFYYYISFKQRNGKYSNRSYKKLGATPTSYKKESFLGHLKFKTFQNQEMPKKFSLFFLCNKLDKKIKKKNRKIYSLQYKLLQMTVIKKNLKKILVIKKILCLFEKLKSQY